jgi:cell division septation protein DedD
MGFRSRVLGVVAALGLAMIALPAAAQEQVDDDCYPIPEGGCPGGEVIDTEEPPETEPVVEQETEPVVEQETEPVVQQQPVIEAEVAGVTTTAGEAEGAQVLGVALAVTGADLALLAALGLVAIGGGGFALRASRRRAGHQTG